jgi:hypothetical protein
MPLRVATRTPNVKAEPAPFVRHSSIGDLRVVHELNVYVERAQAMNRMYTALHRNILDVLNEYGVQIMTSACVAGSAEAEVAPPSHGHEPPAKPPAGQGGAKAGEAAPD